MSDSRMGWIFCLLLSLSFQEGSAQPMPAPGETKSQPARVCIVLAQPGENQTTALKDGTLLWQDPAPPGYGFGEWVWPGGALNLLIKNPSREDLVFKANLTGGKCYVLFIDSKPNPDPKKAATYPSITTAEITLLPFDSPQGQSLTYGITFSAEPLELTVNGKKTTLRKNDPVLLGTGLVRVESNDATISCTEPADACVLLLAYLKDDKGAIYWINSRFF